MKVVYFNMHASNKGDDPRFPSPVSVSYLFLPELNVVLYRENRTDTQDSPYSIREEGPMLDAAKLISEGEVPDWGSSVKFSDNKEFDYSSLALLALVNLARQKAGIDSQLSAGIEKILNDSP